jgi:hypothetical protein
MNIMKTTRYILILVVLCLCTTVMAQMPRTISYQGVLADASGNFISDGNHTLTLKIYDGSGAMLYSETQTAVVVKGLFNVMIGSTAGLPSNLSFDKAYYLGVGVDGGSELTPRTALSASAYAFRAQVAEQALALSPNATGVVTKVNNRSGSLKVIGGGATTVTTSNDTILISSSGGAGGTGIQGVQNGDGALNILSPNGPVATLNVAPSGIVSDMIMNGSITSEKIQDGAVGTLDIADAAVTPSKINAANVTAGFVLTKTAGGVAWNVVPGSAGLTLPFSNSVLTGSTAFDITTTGTGKAGSFKISNANNTTSALYSETNGSGNAFASQISNVANGSDAITATTNGTGSAGSFSNSNTASVSAAVEGSTSSTANGSSITTGAAGVQGLITSTSPGTHSVGVRGINSSLGSAGIGVLGYHNGEGAGVHGLTISGSGVFGRSSDATNGIGVYGVTSGSSGIGVKAEFAGNNAGGISLEVANGFLKVSGGRKTAFQHITTVANVAQNRTSLNYLGMAQTDMLIVTHVLTNNLLNTGCGVWWNNNAWHIFLENNGNMPVGEMFNVLVIKQ